MMFALGRIYITFRVSFSASRRTSIYDFQENIELSFNLWYNQSDPTEISKIHRVGKSRVLTFVPRCEPVGNMQKARFGVLLKQNEY